MNVIKSLQASLVQRQFQYNKKYFSGISVYWGFELSSGNPVLEQDYWSAVAKYIDGTAPLDEGMSKDTPEFLVFGNALSSDEQPVSRLIVNVEFAGVAKSLTVTGDRQWLGTGPAQYCSEPVEFVEMPLDFKHAYGGEDYLANPVGKGFNDELLPNVEYPDKLVTSAKQTPEPASFSTVNCDWPTRKALAGTYDEKYLEDHMPGLALDIDWQYFNAAPKDQWLNTSLVGTESFQFTHLNSQYPNLSGQLPGVLARAFIEQDLNYNEELDISSDDASDSQQLLRFKEVPLTLDTVYFFPNDNLGIVVHRGSCEIAHPFGKDIKKVLLAHENMSDAKRSEAHYQEEMVKRSDPENSWKYLLDSAPLTPIGCTNALKDMIQTEDEMALAENIKTFAEQKELESEEALQKEMDKTCAELEEQGLNDEAEKIKQLVNKEQVTSVDDIEDEDVKKMLEIQNKIVPDVDNLKQELDLSKVNLEAMDELSDHAKVMADKQKLKTIKELEDHIAELEQNKHMAEVPEVIAKLKTLLEELTMLPKLPRIEHAEFDDSAIVQQESIDKQVQSLKDPNVLEHLDDEQKAKLQMVEENLVSFNVDQKQQDAISFMEDSYLQSAHFIEEARSPHEGEELTRVNQLLGDYQDGQPISMRDIAFGELDNASLVAIDLSRALMEYSKLTRCDFSKANLDKANFAHAQLVECNFTNASMADVNLGASKITRCKFREQKFNDVTFAKSQLKETEFIDCHFGERMDTWLETEFVECYFYGCDFSNYNFIELNILGCTFENCTFESTNFVKGKQTGSKFINCQMTAVNFVTPDMEQASFKESVLDNVRFVAGAVLNECDFSHAQVTECNLREAQLNKSNFSHSILNKSDFGSSKLLNATFDKATAIQTQFIESYLQRSSFQRTNMMEASLMQADIRGCDFFEANLYSVSFLQSTLGETSFRGANLANTILKDWRP